MHIERIEDIPHLDAERERWEILESRDPHVTVFTSWRWLRAYFPTSRHPWFVLALRQGEKTLGYFPLSRAGSILDRELYLGGNPVADYTGMIALPSEDDRVIGAFADAIRAQRWDACNLRDVRDPRVERLAHRLMAEGGGLRMESTGEARCRSIDLPATWDQYLKERIRRSSRQNILRVERALGAGLPAFRSGEASSENVNEYVEALVLVKHKRWGGSLKSAQRHHGRLFRNAFDAGLMRIFVYWDGERPIAGAAVFIDAQRSSFCLYQTGFDEEYKRYSPGTGLVAHTIRAAIEGGYARFDFLRGDDAHKAHYASDVSLTRHYRIVRTGLRSDAIAYFRPKGFAIKLMLANLRFGGGRSV